MGLALVWNASLATLARSTTPKQLGDVGQKFTTYANNNELKICATDPLPVYAFDTISDPIRVLRS